MSPPVKIEAATDTLAIAHALQRTAGGVLGDELHFFAYFACLMSIYDGQRPADWGYSFTATAAGAPFAVEVDRSSVALTSAGLLVARDSLLEVSVAGEARYRALSGLSLLEPRVKFLKAATAAAVLMPLPSVREAMVHEPQLRQALRTIGARALLDDAGLELVTAQFSELRAAFALRGSAPTSLVVPAVVWLTYLADSAAESADS